MKRAVAFFSVLLALLSTLTFQNSVFVRSEAEGKGFIIKSMVTYSNPSNGTRTWNFTEEDRTISLFMNNTWQVVHLINSTSPIETVKNDADGNSIAVLDFPTVQLHPGENMSYTVTYQVLSKPRQLPTITENESGTLEHIPPDLSLKYTGREGPWLIDNSTLQELAQNITGSERRVLTIVKKLLTWMKNKIAYQVHEVPLYPNETYDELKGDCDDQAILFITLSRIMGVPAYLQIGSIYQPKILEKRDEYWDGHIKSMLKRIGWHGWAMVYIPPWGWLPIDLTYVIGGFDSVFKAITSAAVTSQDTIQYMNITKKDYVASSREAREFLQTNDFYVYMEDEMILEASPKNSLTKGLYDWLPVMLVAAIVVIITSSFFVYRRVPRRVEAEKPVPTSPLQIKH